MTLSAKATMAVSAGCISVMSWFVQSWDVRRIARPSPLSEGEVTAPAWAAAQSATDEWAAPAELADWREALAGQFEHANAMDRQRAENEALNPPLAAASWVTNTPAAVRPLVLPPLIEPEPDVRLVSADETAADWPESVEPTGEQESAYAAAALEAVAPPLAEAPARKYVVVKGDCLTKIARRQYGKCDAELIRGLLARNPEVRAREGHVLAGEALFLPDEPTVRALAVVAAEAQRAVETEAVRWYTIQPKDSLSSIARRELSDAGRWREILELNRELKKDRILPGMRIKLPPLVRVAQG